MDAEKVQKQAKAIMDDFMKALEDAGEVPGELGMERKAQTREPEKCELTEGFPERMLANAPKTKGRFVMAEKKKW
jgi:hypothetical protein